MVGTTARVVRLHAAHTGMAGMVGRVPDSSLASGSNLTETLHSSFCSAALQFTQVAYLRVSHVRVSTVVWNRIGCERRKLRTAADVSPEVSKSDSKRINLGEVRNGKGEVSIL